MEIKCDQCDKPIFRKPSKVRYKNFCDKVCRFDFHNITRPCVVCGKTVVRRKIDATQNSCCSSECTKIHTSNRFTEMNIELNPDRMDNLGTREKIRNSRFDTGEGKSYPKLYGRHEHRIVAEQMLGRSLKPDEVVHHIDENKRNNDPSNLMVFATQADHAKWHQNLKKKN